MAIIATGGVSNSLFSINGKYQVPFLVLRACFPSCRRPASVFILFDGLVSCASLHATHSIYIIDFSGI